MKDPRDTITIPRRLAYSLLGELEHLAESQEHEHRTALFIAEQGDMHHSYYELATLLRDND